MGASSGSTSGGARTEGQHANKRQAAAAVAETTQAAQRPAPGAAPSSGRPPATRASRHGIRRHTGAGPQPSSPPLRCKARHTTSDRRGAMGRHSSTAAAALPHRQAVLPAALPRGTVRPAWPHLHEFLDHHRLVLVPLLLLAGADAHELNDVPVCSQAGREPGRGRVDGAAKTGGVSDQRHSASPAIVAGGCLSRRRTAWRRRHPLSSSPQPTSHVT